MAAQEDGMKESRKAVWGWALYDWGNSAFATTVMAGFFPVFFKLYWSGTASATESTFALGIANSTASLIVAILAPVLGAIADRGSAKKRFLALFAFLGSLMTVGLWFVAQGDWPMAALLYVFGSVGFFGSLIFYDSLLVSVAPRARWDAVSSLGFALGYLGGGLLFAVNVLMYAQPALFGLTDSSVAVKLSFLLVGVWWLVFTLPLLFWVEEPRDESTLTLRRAVKAGFGQLAGTLRHMAGQKQIFLFLLGYWFYIDGVDTVIKMAVDYGVGLGFPSEALIIALLLVQFVAFPAALLYNKISEKIGIKAAILMGIGAYMVITVFGYFLKDVTGFYILAGCVGLVQGGLQALSRSAFARLVPPDKSGEYFGFFNMFGKFATIIGPVLMGFVTQATGDARLGILSLLVLFVAGGVSFAFVKVPRA
jgi:UMF1 family MFS transporter